MDLQIWLAFSLAAILVLAIPGPTIILVMTQSIAYGRSAVVPLVIGVTLGDLTAMTLSLIGLGAILASSATLFMILKWIGTLYLLYLGIILFRTKPEKSDFRVSPEKKNTFSHFLDAYIVTALNPKSIAFFVAFMPQFVNYQADPVSQLFQLGITFLILAAANAALYGFFASHLNRKIQNDKWLSILNRMGGGVLVGVGIFTATMEHVS